MYGIALCGDSGPCRCHLRATRFGCRSESTGSQRTHTGTLRLCQRTIRNGWCNSHRLQLATCYPLSLLHNNSFLVFCIFQVKMLRDRKANLWLRNAKGDLPLHEAAASGRRELVLWLLDQRPKHVNTTSNDGRTILHIAASNDYTDMCKVCEFSCLELWCDGIESAQYVSLAHSGQQMLLIVWFSVFPQKFYAVRIRIAHFGFDSSIFPTNYCLFMFRISFSS